jgi:hypothetical protein
MYQKFGHRNACDWYSLSLLGFAIILTPLYMGFDPYRDYQNEQRDLEHLEIIAAKQIK